MNELHLQHCIVDMQRAKVHKDGATLTLTTKEVELLRYLAQRPSEIVTRDDLLVDVWGYREGVFSRAVDTTMRRLRNKVEHTPAEPDHLTTVHGEGYRFIPRSENTHIPLGTAHHTAPPASTIPRPSTPLIGRADELASIGDLLDGEGRLISIVGPGGMGKSRLGIELLQAAGRHEGAVHIQVVEGASQAATLEALANKIHTRLEQESEESTAGIQLGNALAQRGPILLVLDDLDGERDILLQAIGTWLERTSELKIVLTTRTRTQLPAEQVVQLGPLQTHDGVALFLERARLLRPDFMPDEDEAQAIETLVESLDGMPLAIELAAARIRLMAPEQILTRLSGSIAFLRGKRPGGLGRHSGLVTMMASSWESLDDIEQRVLVGCTVFRSGFSLHAAESVIGPHIADGDVMEIIEDLVDTSWLRAVESSQGVRFEQYSTIRKFIEEQPEPHAQLSALQDAHMHWFLTESTSRSENIEDRADAKEIAWLEAERANIVAAMRHAAHSEPSIHARLLKGLMESDVARGSVWELNGLLDTLGPLHPETPAKEAAELYTQRAHARRFIGRLEESKQDVERAIKLAEESQDADVMCGARYTAAWVDWDLRNHTAVEQHLANMATHAPDGDQNRWDIRRLFMQAWSDSRSGRLKEAHEAGQRSIQLATQGNEPRRVAMTHQVMAQVARDLDNMSDAISHTEKAAEIFQEIGDTGNVAYAKNALGMLYAVDGDLTEAEPLLMESLEIIRSRHDAHGIALLEGNLGAIRLGLDKLEEANDGLWECLRILDATGIPRGRGFYAAYLGAVRALTDEMGSAEKLMDDAEVALKESGFGATEAFMAAIRAHIQVGHARDASQRDDPDEAAKRLRAAADQGLPAKGEPPALGVVGFAQHLLQQAIDQS